MKTILNWIAVLTVATSVGCATRLTPREKQSLSSLTHSIEQVEVDVANHIKNLGNLKAQSAGEAAIQKADRDLETKQRLLQKLKDRLELEENKLIEQR